METIKYRVVNCNGDEVGTVDLDSEVFGAKVNENVTYDAVRWQLDKKRQGTHSCLTKGEMRGGNRKPWRQKGTGRARAGSNTSPVWVGGGVAHGPKPHGYESRLSKRARRQALISVLSDKVNLKKLVVVDNLKIASGKTKDALSIFSKVGVKGTAAVVLPEMSADVQKSAEWRAIRNLEGVEAIPVEAVSAYDLLKMNYLVSTLDGVSALQKIVKGRSTKQANQ